jgi:hypothetical protein
MGRYVVIDFDDNKDAEAFLEGLKTGHMDGHKLRQVSARVVGIFVKPGRTCKCPDAFRINYGDKNQQEGISRGAKFGWWVCTRCGKPRKAGHQLVNQISASEHPEGPSFDGYEMTVTGLSVTGIARANIKRKKKLRNKGMRK